MADFRPQAGDTLSFEQEIVLKPELFTATSMQGDYRHNATCVHHPNTRLVFPVGPCCLHQFGRCLCQHDAVHDDQHQEVWSKCATEVLVAMWSCNTV